MRFLLFLFLMANPPPSKQPVIRRTAPEIETTVSYLMQLARVVNAHSDKLKTGEQIRSLPELPELLRKMMEQVALVQAAPGLVQSFLTSEFEKTLANSSKLVAGTGITLTPARTGLGASLEVAASGAAGAFPPLDLTTSYVYDDFLGGADLYAFDGTTQSWEKNGSIGQLGWSLAFAPQGGANAGLELFVDGADPEHPGTIVILFPFDPADLNGRAILFGPTGFIQSAGFDKRKSFKKRFVFRLRQNVAHEIVRIGFVRALGSVPIDAKGVYLSFDTVKGLPDTNWQARWFDSSYGDHITDTGITPDMNWHQLELGHTAGDDHVVFTFDGVVVATIAFQEAGDSASMPFFEISGTVPAPGTTPFYLDIDFYDCLISGLTRY